MNGLNETDNGLLEFSDLIADGSRLASLSYQFKGRWYKINTKILGFTDSIVHLLSIPEPADPQASIDLSPVMILITLLKRS